LSAKVEIHNLIFKIDTHTHILMPQDGGNSCIFSLNLDGIKKLFQTYQISIQYKNI